MLSKDRKTEIIDRFKKHEVDTGSPEVQIGILTERIAQYGGPPSSTAQLSAEAGCGAVSDGGQGPGST